MKKYLLLHLLALTGSFSYAASDLRHLFREADRFFKTTVTDGKVDYELILKDPSAMENLATLFAETDLSAATRKQKKAFYINAFNLLVIKTIVSHYPVRSPYEIDGFFSEIVHRVGREDLTLNQIQKEKLLGSTCDLRIVFALCQGTTGSFPLSDHAFSPGRLNRQLNRKVRQYANDMNFVRVKKNSSRLLVCESFIYCLKLNGKITFLTLLNRFRNEEVPENFLVDFYPVKQELNAVSPETSSYSSKLK